MAIQTRQVIRLNPTETKCVFGGNTLRFCKCKHKMFFVECCSHRDVAMTLDFDDA